MELRVVRLPIDHPDAALLVEEVQAEYVERYGGRDETPLEPAYFEPPAGSFFVGYLDGVPVASGAWRFRPLPDGAPGTRAAEVKRMYVVPAARRTGLASQLLAHLEKDAARAGADVMVLETGLAQPEAIALYSGAGYVRIEPFAHYRHSPMVRCFARALPPGTAPEGEDPDTPWEAER